MQMLSLASSATLSRGHGTFATRATLVLVAVLLAALLLSAIEVRFGVTPTAWNEISAM
jgi:hypothetical protein